MKTTEMNKYLVTASIVLYKNKIDELKRAIDSFLDTELPVRIYLIDNSPTPELENITNDKRAEYFYLNYCSAEIHLLLHHSKRMHSTQ